MARTINSEIIKFRTAAALKSFQKNRENVSYYHLRKLVDEGLIGTKEVQSGKRGRNPLEYHLTQKGKDYVQNYIESLKQRLEVFQ